MEVINNNNYYKIIIIYDDGGNNNLWKIAVNNISEALRGFNYF